MSRFTWCLTALCLVGCGDVVRLKGTGASGLAKTVEVENSRMVHINKLTDEAQTQYNLAHRTFDNVFSPVAGKTAPAELVDKLKKIWPTLTLADVAKGQRFHHSLVLNTNEGTLKIGLFYDMDPDAARSIHALGLSGFFEGKELKLVNNRLLIGDRIEHPVNFKSLGNRVPSLMYGAVAIQALGEDVVTPNLSIILAQEAQPKPKDQKDILAAYLETEIPAFEAMLLKIKAGKKVVIQSVITEKRSEELFDAEQGAKLPHTDPKTGRIAPRQPTPTRPQ